MHTTLISYCWGQKKNVLIKIHHASLGQVWLV